MEKSFIAEYFPYLLFLFLGFVIERAYYKFKVRKK